MEVDGYDVMTVRERDLINRNGKDSLSIEPKFSRVDLSRRLFINIKMALL
jgi:hypothetical protein